MSCHPQGVMPANILATWTNKEGRNYVSELTQILFICQEYKDGNVHCTIQSAAITESAEGLGAHSQRKKAKWQRKSALGFSPVHENCWLRVVAAGRVAICLTGNFNVELTDVLRESSLIACIFRSFLFTPKAAYMLCKTRTPISFLLWKAGGTERRQSLDSGMLEISWGR